MSMFVIEIAYKPKAWKHIVNKQAWHSSQYSMSSVHTRIYMKPALYMHGVVLEKNTAKKPPKIFPLFFNELNIFGQTAAKERSVSDQYLDFFEQFILTGSTINKQ